MTKETQPSIDLVAAIRAATAEDLAEIRERIDALSKELEALRAVERVVNVAVNGKPPRKSPAPRAAKQAEREDSLADLIFECISHHGPGTSREIALKLGTTAQSVGVTCAKSDWFERCVDNAEKWTIALTRK